MLEIFKIKQNEGNRDIFLLWIMWLTLYPISMSFILKKFLYDMLCDSEQN